MSFIVLGAGLISGHAAMTECDASIETIESDIESARIVKSFHCIRHVSLSSYRFR
ncbi:hypothetical protein [Pseudomonas phage vB_Pae_BR313c]|nr:hypothetical protein [Pseudomonas phage vB_Pae_BR313c]